MKKIAIYLLIAGATAWGCRTRGPTVQLIRDVYQAGDRTETDINRIQDVPVEGDAVVKQGPFLGVLQFSVRHDLNDDKCVLGHNCYATFEETQQPDQWFARLAGHSNMAVYHWDKAIPWDVFAVSPPSGSNPLSYYEGRMDPATKQFIDSVARYFGKFGVRYLAVSLLSGTRDSLQPLYQGQVSKETPVGGQCPDLDKGTVFTVQGSAGALTIDVRTAYLNFLTYLYDKLHPRYFALAVEINLFKRSCPDQWPAMAAFYREMYAGMRPRVAPGTELFATVSYLTLLGYDFGRCTGGMDWVKCGTQDQSKPPKTDTRRCFQVDTQTLKDLDRGNSLDILALSFYPDSLVMAVPHTQDPYIYAYPSDWDAKSECAMKARIPDLTDPLPMLDSLDWHKPIAVAEWSARSCPTLIWAKGKDSTMLLKAPSGSNSQFFWMKQVLEEARRRGFEFVVYSFLQDYDLVMPRIVQKGLLSGDLYDVLNMWPCSGLYDRDMKPKGQATALWNAALQTTGP